MGALLVAGCGPELLGGAQGEVRTVATSDDDGSAQHRGAAQANPSHASFPSPSEAGESPASLEGEILVDAAVWLLTEDGEAVPVTDGQVPGSFRIEGEGESLLGRADLEARTYTAVRVLFTRVTAVVENGLLVNGIPVIGPVHVDLGAGGSLSIERPLEVSVEGRTTRTLVVDLDAHEWLPTAVFPGPLVSADAFGAAVDVRLR